MRKGDSQAFIKEGHFVCECGKEFTKSQALYGHQGRCKVHMGSRPIYNFGANIKYITDEARQKSGQTRKKPIEEFLIKGSSHNTNYLKYRLLEEGLKEHQCENCQNVTWLGHPIPLELHHKDGDRSNNQLENLLLLCPNCHSFTETFCGRNTAKARRI